MPDKYQALREAATRATPGERKYGVRRDGSIWLSIGDPAKGPHYQGDLVSTDADADLICATSPAAIQTLLAERDRFFSALQEISHPEAVRGDATKIARSALTQ